DTVLYSYGGANQIFTVAPTVGTGLTAQGLFALIEENDTGTSAVQELTTTNASGLVPLIWQKIGTTQTGNGNMRGECWMATGGSIFSGATTTTVLLTSTPTTSSAIHVSSWGGVNQASI